MNKGFDYWIKILNNLFYIIIWFKVFVEGKWNYIFLGIMGKSLKLGGLKEKLLKIDFFEEDIM